MNPVGDQREESAWGIAYVDRARPVRQQPWMNHEPTDRATDTATDTEETDEQPRRFQISLTLIVVIARRAGPRPPSPPDYPTGPSTPAAPAVNLAAPAALAPPAYWEKRKGR